MCYPCRRSELSPMFPVAQGGCLFDSAAARSQRTSFVAAAIFAAMLWSSVAHAQRIDTEHLFGFMIGTDVGEPGDKEIEGETVARWGKRPGSYFAAAPAFEAEFVPNRESARFGNLVRGLSRYF